MVWIKKREVGSKIAGDTGRSQPPTVVSRSLCALNLYLEISEDDQQKIEKTEERLKVAYKKAYSKLGNGKWTGEQVDDYASEIRRLITLVRVSGEAMEKIVRLVL